MTYTAFDALQYQALEDGVLVGNFCDKADRDAYVALMNGSTPPPPDPTPLPVLPSGVLDLRPWKLTTWQNKEITQPALAKFKEPGKFEVVRQASGRPGVLFRAPIGGATTSGSKYPREELREMTTDGWSNRSGTHQMVIVQSIDELPLVKPHVVAGQIHDAVDDVTVCRLEGKILYVTQGDNTHFKILDRNYVLGALFKLQIIATSGGIAYVYNNGTPVKVPGVFDGCYFKAGCYTQSNEEQGDEAGAAGAVTIQSLSISHT